MINARKPTTYPVTHTGMLRHINPKVHAVPVKLHGTKLYWVTRGGVQYKKRDGTMKRGGPEPFWRLDLASVRRVDS